MPNRALDNSIGRSPKALSDNEDIFDIENVTHKQANAEDDSNKVDLWK